MNIILILCIPYIYLKGLDSAIVPSFTESEFIVPNLRILKINCSIKKYRQIISVTVTVLCYIYRNTCVCTLILTTGGFKGKG